MRRKTTASHNGALYAAVLVLIAAAELSGQQPSRPPADPTASKPGAVASAPLPALSAGPNQQRRIVVSIPDRRLALVVDGEVVRQYPVAVGAQGTPTPAGEFRVANRVTRPTYYNAGARKPVVPPGKDNPLGSRWIGLSAAGYGIHGTNEPDSIGGSASKGCIRMHNRDVEELFELVRPGDTVEFHARSTPELARLVGAPQQPSPQPQPAAPVVVAAVTGN